MRTEPAREPEPEYAFVVNVDVQGSGLLSDPEKSAMRQRLYEVTGRAFEQTGIREPRLYQEDRGDGVLSLLSAGVPPKQVLGEWLEHLHQNLRAVNAGLAHPLRIRAGDDELSFLSTVTTFGTAVDLNAAKVSIEAFLPADERTA